MRIQRLFTALVWFFLAGMAFVASAQNADILLSENDKTNIKSTIQAQLDAFQADDAEKAVSLF